MPISTHRCIVSIFEISDLSYFSFPAIILTVEVLHGLYRRNSEQVSDKTHLEAIPLQLNGCSLYSVSQLILAFWFSQRGLIRALRCLVKSIVWRVANSPRWLTMPMIYFPSSWTPMIVFMNMCRMKNTSPVALSGLNQGYFLCKSSFEYACSS